MKQNQQLLAIEAKVRQYQGHRIRVLRKKINLTQKQLSRKLNMSVYHLSRYENGLKDFDVQVIKQFAKALKVTTDNLLGIEIVTGISSFKDLFKNTK